MPLDAPVITTTGGRVLGAIAGYPAAARPPQRTPASVLPGCGMALVQPALPNMNWLISPVVRRAA
jgi:hypothetical protein